MIPSREETGPPSREGPLSPEQRMEGLCFPFPSLPSRCQPLGAPGLWGMCGVVGVGGWRSLAAPSGWIRAAPWDQPPKPSAWEGQGSEGKCRRQRFVSSHLISSFAAFRGRFNLLGSGKRLPLQRWLHTNDQGLSSSSPGCQGQQRGSLAPPRRGHVARGHVWG